MSNNIISISYTIQNVQKPLALNQYVENMFSGNYIGLNYSGGTVYDFNFKKQLTQEQRTQLDTLVANYTDPESWLVLNHKESMPMTTNNCNSIDFTNLHTFIMTCGTEYASPCSDFKTIINCNTPAIEAFADYDENSNDTITLQIYCSTRDIVVIEEVIDVTNILKEWKTLANNGQTGYAQKYMSKQIYGIADKIPSDFDCVWSFIGKVSNPLFQFSLNGLQKLFYVRMYD